MQVQQLTQIGAQFAETTQRLLSQQQSQVEQQQRASQALLQRVTADCQALILNGQNAAREAQQQVQAAEDRRDQHRIKFMT